MPKRPIQHEIADKAVAAVERVFAECGFATQRVHPDYGEDLFVQTSLNGVIDPHRIWVQVKGTANWDQHRRDDGFRLRVSTDTALKWARSADTVVAVLWDVGRMQGVWTIPESQINEWDFVFDRPKTLSITLPADHALDIPSVEGLTWDVRYTHYENLLAQTATHEAVNALDEHQDEDEASPGLQPLITFDFLRLIGLFAEGDTPVSQTLLRWHAEEVSDLEQLGNSENDARRHAATKMVMTQAQRASGGRPTPGLLIELGADLAQRILDDWPDFTVDSPPGPAAF